jgi:hypothetical protein
MSMSIMRRKRFWVAVALFTTGTVFQYLPTGCTNYLTAQALTAFDFCEVLNCTGGTFFNFCSPTVLFTDCPATTTTTQ